jgi:heat shock protein HslJ
VKTVRFLHGLLFMLILALPTACVPTEPEAEPTVEPTNNSADLIDTPWRLVSFGPAGGEAPVVAGSMVTLTLSGDSQAGGSGGCNNYGGTYQLDGDHLTFGQFNSTLRACADANMMQQETEYFQALQSVARFTINGDQLTLTSADGQNVLNFERG